MAWCEENGVEYVFGLAKNDRLVAQIKPELEEAEREAKETGAPARRFKEFMWETLESWSRKRRVIGKAEWTKGEANPRFIVTSPLRTQTSAQALYEDIYCQRGDLENRWDRRLSEDANPDTTARHRCDAALAAAPSVERKRATRAARLFAGHQRSVSHPSDA